MNRIAITLISAICITGCTQNKLTSHLSLSDAAIVAQKKFDEMKLPPSCFLKSIAYSPLSPKNQSLQSSTNPQPCYFALIQFDKEHKPEIDSKNNTIKVKYILVRMDGQASIEEIETVQQLPHFCDR